MVAVTEEQLGIDISEIVPSFNINKIIIFEKSIRLLCSLEKENLVSESWFGSSDFLEHLDMYILVTKALSSSEVSEYYWPRARASRLATNPRDLKTWTNRWVQKEQRTEHGIVGHKVVNFDEIINGNHFFPVDREVNSNFRSSAFFSDPMSVQNDFNASMEDNTFFEIEVPLDEEWLSPPQAIPGGPSVPSSDPHRNLLAFIHLDLKGLADKYGLSNFTGVLSKIGGQLHYEKILELRDDTYRQSLNKEAEDYLRWMVPETISYYQDQVGNTYRGQVHYHHPDPDNPGAYVGYMEGPDSLGPGEENMDDRRKLTKRNVRNTKVVSKLFLEQALGWDGKPLTNRNKFNGYKGMLLNGSPPLMRTTGGDPFEKTRAQVGLAMIAVDNTQEVADRTGELEVAEVNPMNTLYGAMLKRVTIRGAVNAKANITFGAVETYTAIPGDGARSNYSTPINLNFENLIKSHSKHGYFLDFHRDALSQEVTDPSSFGSEIFSPEYFSHQFIKGCMLKSNIYSVVIRRRRLTNLPISNNPLGTNDYQRYDTNEIEEELIIGTNGDALAGRGEFAANPFRFPDAQNTKASIFSTEEDRSAQGLKYTPEGYILPFVLKDYDLFRRIQTGKYAYSISIQCRDGISEYLENFCDSFQRFIDRFSQFLNRAQSPFQVVVSNGERSVTGNYDYEKEIFTQKFKQAYDNDEFGMKSFIDNLVTSYMQAVYLLTKQSANFNRSAKNTLVRMIEPQQGQISSMTMFLDACQKILNTLKSIVYEGAPEISKTMNLGTHKRIANKKSEIPGKMIQIDGIIKNAVAAVPKNAVFCEMDNGQLVFFTLTEVGDHTPFESTEGGIEEQEYIEDDTIQSTLGEEGFQYDSSGSPIAKASQFVRTTIGRGQLGYSKAIAAAYHSTTKETFSHDTQAGHSDPVDDIDGSLSQFGGTTLNYLLSETMGNVDTEINQCGETLETQREISRDIEDRIVESIVTSEDREQFINEIDSIYKDYYFKKESLGGLYDFLVHLMGSKKALKRADEKLKKSKKEKKKGTNYEKLAKSGKSMSEYQAEEKNDTKSETDYQKKVSTSTEVMTAKGEWVDIALEPNNSLKMYRTVLKDDLSDSKHIYFVNNFKAPRKRTTSASSSETSTERTMRTESEKYSQSSSTQSQSNVGGTASSTSGGSGGSSGGGSGY